MPRYDFECKKCNAKYDDLVAYDKTGKYPGVVCPECGSKRKTKMMSACSFNFANPVGTDRHTNSHDYRFHHNLPKVLAERQAAEEAAASQQAYENINDLNVDSAWGSDGNAPEEEIQL